MHSLFTLRATKIMDIKEILRKNRSGEKLTETEIEEVEKFIRKKTANAMAKLKAGIVQNSNNEGNK